MLKLLALAEEIHGHALINEHIQTTSNGSYNLNNAKSALSSPGQNIESLRLVIAKASQTKKRGWFKRIDWMQRVASEIVITGATWPTRPPQFKSTVEQITSWCFKD